MLAKLLPVITLGIFLTSGGRGQTKAADRPSVPIYRLTVVERTVKAVSYQYRSGPTEVDFRGTVLLPKAKGSAQVESKAGRTEIEARFEHVAPPTRYGREYLTYVLWAITPEGHARNLGEVLANGSDRASLHVTTDLQTFGMIVTAEPYSAVRQPSDVVVMENEVRKDTIGHIEQISARYELLPRGEYTYEVPRNLEEAGMRGPSVSMDDYEKTVEVYQAQNAVQIARSAGADTYAPEVFSKAERLLRDSQQFQARGADKSTVVTAARHAAQTAEDARTIALKRKQDEAQTLAQQRISEEQEMRTKAEAEAQQARSEAQRARAEAERAQAAAQRARAEASADRMELEGERTAHAARTLPAPAQTTVQTAADSQKTELRRRILRDLSAAMETRDTPRGLVVTVPNPDFRGTALSPAVYARLARIAAAVAVYPGLQIEVDGHTDSSGSAARREEFSYARAAAVRDALVRSGIPANSVSVRGLGSSRPLVSNASAAGRQQNRRVEITIAGDAIGTLPYWDRTYSVVR